MGVKRSRKNQEHVKYRIPNYTRVQYLCTDYLFIFIVGAKFDQGQNSFCVVIISKDIILSCSSITTKIPDASVPLMAWWLRDITDISGLPGLFRVEQKQLTLSTMSLSYHIQAMLQGRSRRMPNFALN